VRPDNPKLLAILNQAIAAIGGNATKLSNRNKVYLSKIKQLHGATQGADMQRFQATVGIFKRYAGEYGFDTLLLLSQSYQESRLNQNARSHVGAIGLMQLMAATGNSLGVGDVHRADANVHAGAKYMARLLDVYFKDSHFDEQNRNLFAFAAYNAGPNKIRRLQQEAAAQKLDPNLWFDNVERVAAAQVGQEPVRYVRNIYKYYVAYKLIEDAEATKRSAKP
jgi:membrane-bound lytic murein transglycosylase MltF